MAGLSAPAALAQRDLTLRGAIWLAATIVAVVVGADLTDGRLGALTSYGLIMASATAPLAVDPRHLWSTVFIAPLLLLATMTVVAIFAASAIDPAGMPDTAGRAARVLAGAVDRGVTLAIAEGLTLIAIGMRRLGHANDWAARAV